jgi:GNAT superfamily N-acetyltransferase
VLRHDAGVDEARLEVRRADQDDAAAVAALAAELGMSFTFSAAAFAASFPALLADPQACLLVAAVAAGADADGTGRHSAGGASLAGYLLGFRHHTFYANGPVGWVEEILVRGEYRRCGAGRELMAAFEGWGRERGCALVALATRRAAPFYRALGYEESAIYHRKLL